MDVEIRDQGRTYYPIDQVVVDHDFNCRGHISPIDVAELAKDIQANGLIQPVVLQPLNEDDLIKYPGKKWKLIAGFRRTVATRVTGDTHVWAVIHETANEYEARFFNLRENLQRKELTFTQEATAIAPLVKSKVTRKAIADKLGLSEGWVQLRIMYLQLPEPIRKEIDTGAISQTGIREIHTALIRAGETAAIQVTRELKDAKIKGLKGVPKVIAKLQNRDRKAMRSKADLNDLTERVVDMFGCCLASRCLAWGAGEISDSDLEASLKEHAGDKYKGPDDDDSCACIDG